MSETSIVIRTHNEEKHLGNLLQAIREQDYKDCEVIVVDSSSTDRTVEIAREFDVKVISIESRDFTFGYALNVGCEASQGRYLVFASAHVLPVDKNWLSNLIAPFSDSRIAMVYGRQVGNEQSKFSEKNDFKRIFGPKAVDSSIAINYANNANSAIRKKLWEDHRFDQYLFGLEDIDWAQAMVKKGYHIRYEPGAAIYHIHTEAWHQIFNRYRREAIATVRIGLPHPPQARTGILWLFWRLTDDILSSFPNWSFKRLEEILRFRYYQWKGTRQGWFKDRGLDLDRDKQDLFFHIKNQSVVIKGLHRAEMEEVPIPEMKPGDILLEVDYVGICRTDLEVLEGTLGYYRDGVADYPIVPGHEFSGTIVKIGSNNKFRERFKIGQKVVGECILSRRSEDRKEVGVINYNGAYSQYIVMPGDALHKIENGLDSKKASLAEPVAVVLRAIRRIKDRLFPGAKVAVMGAGPIGNLCAQALTLEGYKVTIFDRNATRLELLKEKVEGVSLVVEGLDKFDVIIEATGSKELLEQVIKESRTDGTIMLLGFPYGDISYNFEDLVGHEKVFAGSVGGDREDFPKALDLLPQIEIPEEFQTVLPLKDFKRAWELHRTGKYLKIFLQP